MKFEKAKLLGALGAVVSICTVWLWIVETLPTLSSATHSTVVMPGPTSTEAVAALTTVAVPLVVGSVPSVV